MLCLCLVATTVSIPAVEVGTKPVAYVFPDKLKWTFDFVMGKEEIRGTGIGLIDWSNNNEKPSYYLKETYDPTTHTDHFKVESDTISGNSGKYTYSYTTTDGKTGCLSAAFTAFPQTLFSEKTWKGFADYDGVKCHKYEAQGSMTGVQNSLIEMLLCNNVPVMTKWTTPSYGGTSVTQISYTNTFESLTDNILHEELQQNPTLFSFCETRNKKINKLERSTQQTIGNDQRASHLSQLSTTTVEGQKRQAYRELQNTKSEIGVWEHDMKIKADLKAEIVKPTIHTKEREVAIKAAEEEKETIERSAEVKALEAEKKYFEIVAALESKQTPKTILASAGKSAIDNQNPHTSISYLIVSTVVLAAAFFALFASSSSSSLRNTWSSSSGYQQV